MGTKVHPPPLRRRLVERAQLTHELRGEDAQAARLVLVSAPAGFGKTTLLAQWMAAAAPYQSRVARPVPDASGGGGPGRGPGGGH